MKCQILAKQEKSLEALKLKERLRPLGEMVRLEDDLKRKTENRKLFKIQNTDTYYIDLEGNVFSVKVHKLKIVFDEYGYKKVCCRELKTKKKHYTIHRAMANTFLIKNNPTDEVRHLDGDQLNNCLLNLEWGSRQDNIADKIKHGTFYRGGKTHKLNLSQVEEIRSRHQQGESLKSLSRFFKVTAHHIGNIVKYKKWNVTRAKERLLIMTR